MNVYFHELRMAKNSMITWIFVLILVTALFMSIFPAFNADAEASRKMLAGFPPQIQAMFGLSMQTFLTFLGFYAYTFTYVGLAGAVQAMNLGLTMLSREVSNKTSDFLLTKPITRTTVFWQKLLAALTVLIITNLVIIAATLLFSVVFGAGTFSLKIFSLLALAFFLVQLMFLGIGILVSQLLRIKSVISVSLGIVFGFFVIGMLQGLTDDDKLRYITPFKYYDHMQIVIDKHYEQPFVWLTIAVIAVSMIVGYVIYRTRDTRSVA